VKKGQVRTIYLRQEQADIRFQCDGVNYGDGNSWFSLTGGDLTAAGAKTRPGAMGNEVELGGFATRSDVTIETQNSDIMVGQHAALESKIGKGSCRVSVQYIDNYGNAISGKSWTIKGKLKSAHLPEVHTENAAVGMFTVVVGCDELAA
jgi:hypothetical protein